MIYIGPSSIININGPTAIASIVTDASCGTANGSITLGVVTGGASPYTYSVDGSAFTATATYSGLTADLHSVTVKDINGCTFSASLTINNIGGPTAIASTVTDASCGTANGSITLGAISGGTSPYTYSIDGSTYSSVIIYTNLSASVHTIDVKDANGCIYSTSVSIINNNGPTAIASNVTDASCGTSNGSITLGSVPVASHHIPIRLMVQHLV